MLGSPGGLGGGRGSTAGFGSSFARIARSTRKAVGGDRIALQLGDGRFIVIGQLCLHAGIMQGKRFEREAVEAGAE